jgi:hypothetical protein
MRKGDRVEFLYNKTNKGKVFMGLTTGTDTCAEHECGIKGLRTIFGVPQKLTDESIGLKNHAATRGAGDNLEYEDAGKFIFLRVAQAAHWETPKTPMKKKVPHDISGYETREYLMENGVCAAWNSDGFFVIAKEEHRKPMELLRDALIAGNIAFLNLGRWNKLPPTSGLAIVLLSTLPKYVNQELEREHKETLERKTLFEESGIEKRLRDAGKEWFFLGSPKINGKNEMIIWLNPMHQRIDNSGWFTVAELDAWIKGEGPIPMKDKKENR